MTLKFTGAAGLLLAAIATQACADDNATPKLHPLEKACVTYQMSGQMMNGTSTRCHRDYGYEQYEIQNMTAGIAGFTQETNQHTITVGETIYAIDLDTNTGTQTANPLYAQIVESLENSSPEDMAENFLTAMGFTATDQTKTVAGMQCKVYNSSMMGAACLTDNGLMLEQSIMGNTTVATNVAVGDAGEAANYTLYQNVPITEGPQMPDGLNLQDLMQQMQPPQQ